MKKLLYRFKTHPGGFLRDTEIHELPNPEKDTEQFLVLFLFNFQSDDRISYLDDLYKLLHDDFSDEKLKEEFIENLGMKTENEIENEIKLTEQELKNEAYKNFYFLVLNGKIEIIDNGKK